MSRIIKGILPLIILIASSVTAAAQSGCPAIVTGAVLTAAQWNNCFILKQDSLGYTPVNKAGDTMLGRFVTLGSASPKAGFAVTPGTAPASPLDGDIWIVSGGGMYYQSNGATVGPLFGTNGSAALSSVNDTNVLVTLSGTPATALLKPVTMTLGWTGTLSLARGGTGSGTQAGAANNIFPTPTRAGDIVYWNGTAWVTLAGNNVGTKILQQTSTGVPSWVAAGAGTVTSITAGTGLSGGTITGSGTIALALTNASLQASPTAPGTTTSTAVMAGLGGTCKLTPVYSGRVLATFNQGYFQTGGTSSGFSLQVRFGTGTAPLALAAVAGTTVGSNITVTSTAGNTFAIGRSVIITGLTPGTAYWFDESFGNNNASTTGLNAIDCSLMEY